MMPGDSSLPAISADPQALTLFFQPAERLRLTVEGRCSYVTVKPVWAAPLSHPGRYLSLVDEKGEEIVLLEDPAVLPAASYAALREELHRRYLTASITRVEVADVQHGATYFVVQTDRGERDFVMQSIHENAIWFSETHVLLVDTDANRFEVPDTRKLDPRSQALLRAVF